MPGDAKHSRPGSASAHHQYGGFHGPGGLARSPAFSYGGGEAPTAQEATPEETLEVTLVATPLDSTEEGDDTADTDYVVDMAATQSTWDPWLHDR